MKSLPTKKTHVIGAALFAAALSFPSYHAAFAEAAPEKGIVAFKYLNYKDSQPDQEEGRVGVSAFTVMGMAPIAGKWSINTSFTHDSVSGASPDGHTSIVSGASQNEIRMATDLGVTRYFPDGSVTLGHSFSAENDYISRGYSGQGNFTTDDKNTTFTLGGSYTTDTIQQSHQDTPPRISTGKRTVAGLVGVTQVVDKNNIVQLNFGYSRGKGDFNDLYKKWDVRPDRRVSKTVMTRWNHHFEGTDGTGRLSYRFYTDTFGINAHTLGYEYVQPLPCEWTVTPSVRLYSQTAADFYVPTSAPTGGPEPYSIDQRLSAFGALTLGIKVEKRIAKEWLVDARFDTYMQRAEWCLSGGGDQGLEHFSFNSVQLGVSKEF